MVILDAIKINENKVKGSSGIYAIVCKSTTKGYIGSACNMSKRWAAHRQSLKNGKHHSPYLQNAWNKYGSTDFIFGILECVKIENLIDREQFWMNTFQSYIPEYGFNMAKTAGPQSFLGKKHSTETKKRIGAGNKGKFVSEETRKKIGEASRKRAPASKETRRKLSECVSRRKMTNEYRQKLSESARGKHAKLTIEQIKTIKITLQKPYYRGMYRQIAKEVGIDERQIYAIKIGKIWAWV